MRKTSMNTSPSRTVLAVLILGAWSAVLLAVEPLPREKEITNSLGMKLVRIEAGEFTMGTGERPPKSREEWLTRDADEAPAHKVTISRPFFLGAYEVTNAQYEQFDPDHKKWRGRDGGSTADDEP